MTSNELNDAEKIVRMTEWNEQEAWECSDSEEHIESNHLAAAKRFLAAQAFLLSWQEGKVPTGWRRARRLTDFDGEYPQAVVDAAEDIIAERIAIRNFEKTAKLNAVILSKEKSGNKTEKGEETGKVGKVDKEEAKRKEVEKLKSDLTTFSHDFFQAKSALSKATSAIADISFRIQALSEIIES